MPVQKRQDLRDRIPFGEVDQDEFEHEMRRNMRPFEIEGLVSTAHVPNDDGRWAVVAVLETKVEAMAAVDRIRAE